MDPVNLSAGLGVGRTSGQQVSATREGSQTPQNPERGVQGLASQARVTQSRQTLKLKAPDAAWWVHTS